MLPVAALDDGGAANPFSRSSAGSVNVVAIVVPVVLGVVMLAVFAGLALYLFKSRYWFTICLQVPGATGITTC